MAGKAIVCKASVQLADVDRSVYCDRALTIVRHPSETDERMMVRLLAFALHADVDERDGALEFAKGMWDPDEPELWRKDLTGRIVDWIEVGQPEERRVTKASGRSERVSVYAFGSNAAAWWTSVAGRAERAGNVDAWLVPADQSRALAALADRSMQLQIIRQDGIVWVADGTRSVEIRPRRLSSERG
jgi:uncharacterized protein YaeQ